MAPKRRFSSFREPPKITSKNFDFTVFVLSVANWIACANCFMFCYFYSISGCPRRCPSIQHTTWPPSCFFCFVFLTHWKFYRKIDRNICMMITLQELYNNYTLGYFLLVSKTVLPVMFSSDAT